MSFYTALNGIANAQTELDSVSNNLANAQTTGFKKSRVNFADIVAGSAYTNPKLVQGIGSRVKTIDQNFSTGPMQSTGSALDLAINGQGFFSTVNPVSGDHIFTRNGNFSTDSSGYIVDQNGNRLQLLAATNGAGTTTYATTPTDGLLPPSRLAATTSVALSSTAATVNVSDTSFLKVVTSGGTTEYTQSAGLKVSGTSLVDSQGNTVQPAITIPASTTSVTVAADGTVSGILSGATSSTVLGQLTVTNFTTPSALTSVGNGYYTANATTGTGTDNSPSSSGYGSLSGVGTTTTTYTGLQISTDGVVTASYADGTSTNIGKIALATFVAPTGLLQLGDQDWKQTGLSGSPTYNAPQAGGTGNVLSGYLEQSNVDVSTELVNMISAQQYFQANSKMISTNNTLMQAIMNATG